MTSQPERPPTGGPHTGHPWESRARTLVVVVAFPAFSLLYLWQALVIDMPGRPLVVSPRSFPTLLGVLMVIVSIVVAVKELRSNRQALAVSAGGAVHGPDDDEELGVLAPLDLRDEEEPDDDEISSWRDVALVAAAFVAYVALFRPVGFFVTTFAFLAGLACYFAPKHWLRNVIVCLIFTVATAYVFGGLLEVELPAGIFGVSF